MRIVVSHSLTVEDAQARMDALLGHWQRKYGIRAEWTGPVAAVTGSVLGFKVKARLELAGAKVVLDGPDPGFLVRKRVSTYLDEKLRFYLAPERTIAELRAAQS
jgi:hypothetical protein